MNKYLTKKAVPLRRLVGLIFKGNKNHSKWVIPRKCQPQTAFFELRHILL